MAQYSLWRLLQQAGESVLAVSALTGDGVGLTPVVQLNPRVAGAMPVRDESLAAFFQARAMVVGEDDDRPLHLQYSSLSGSGFPSFG